MKSVKYSPKKIHSIEILSEKLLVVSETASVCFSCHHLGGINKQTHNPVYMFTNKYMYIIYVKKVRILVFLLTRNISAFIIVLLLIFKLHISHFHNLTYCGVKFL